MSFRDEYVQETVSILKERYDLTLAQLIDAYVQAPTVPASIFRTILTPFEAITKYLFSIQELSEREIGELLSRRTSAVKQALENADAKGVAVREDEDEQYRVPLTHFEELTPAEAVVVSLKEAYELRNADVARILDKDPRNTHSLHKRATKKMGGGKR